MKAIETIYRGHLFRSRLEARWAVFFDVMGYPWEYEPEGFELPNGERYLPDFRISFTDSNNDFNTFWFEVKPHLQGLSASERRKIEGFKELAWSDAESGQHKITAGYGDFIILDGAPDYKLYEGTFHPDIDGCKWAMPALRRNRPFYWDGSFKEALEVCGVSGHYYCPGVIAARSARFDRGGKVTVIV